MPTLLVSDWWHDLERRRRRLVCRCDDPTPELVRLFGCVPVEGAYECRRCGRKVV